MAENVINAENGEILKDSINNGPYQLKPEITVKDTDGVTNIRRPQRVEDLAGQEMLCYDSDIKAVNILLLGLPVDIYTLINHYQTAKEIWDRVTKLMEGTKMTKQEHESMLYDEFDKFTSKPGESIHSYYLRFAKLINDIKMIPFLSKQARDLHSVNFDQLYAFLKHNEKDAKEVREMRQRFPEPLALLANTYNPPPSYSSQQIQGKSTKGNQMLYCNGEGHIAKQCTAKKKVKDSKWFKDKMLLAQAQEAGLQATINFKSDHVDAYESDCDDEATANAIFMENLSLVVSINDDMVEPRYDSDILSEVPHYDTYHDSDMLNSNIQELGYIENIVSNNESYDELMSNSNVISYTNYMLTIGNDADNYVPPLVQKNDMMLSVIEKMKSQVEKSKKELENIVFKVGQYAQTMHMLTKPQKVYDETHKSTLGYQNPLYLSQARRKQPALYNGHVLIDKHNAISVCDSEETLILAEHSRLKMIEKQTEINAKQIDYSKLNKLYAYFVPQKQFKLDECIKRRTTLSPYQIGSWEQSDIKGAFKKDVIPFSENLKETFKLFEKGFIAEVKEMKDIFEQIEYEDEQCFVAKKCFEIEKKQLLINNDQLLEENISCDIMCTYLHSLNEFDN
ncbi:hypothetical protein Tco_1459229 [Tanacetum coccineum]